MEWAEGGHMSPRDGPGHYLTWGESFDQENEHGLKRAPLQLDDVLLDLQSVDKHGGQGFSRRGFGQHRLNVKGLILACVQAALSMVKDKVENTSKETDRVALVLKLLHQEQVEGQTSILHWISCQIAKLLKGKISKTHVSHMAQHWPINEAAASETINKAGTFRRSCIRTLETKVSPILAGILAYLDTNDNLQILQEHCQWKQELWLTFLNTAEAINMQFTDLQTPVKQSGLQEVVVITTGCEGHMFCARMPFSWLLINQINEILKLPHPSLESHDHEERDREQRTESAVKVLSEHAVGNVLSCVNTEQAITEAVHEYIHDFVHTMYHAASGHENQLVYQYVYHVISNMANETTEITLLRSLVNVHTAYQKLAQRLTYFRTMNSVWPDCSATIIDLKEKNPDHYMFKEQEFTFSALCLLLDNLSPKGTDLNNVRGRSHWLSKFHRYRPVVENVISLHGEDPILYGAHNSQSVRRAKGLWSRVMVVKLFLEHVCTSEDKITIECCMPLWEFLGEETDLKEMKSLTRVIQFLKYYKKDAMKEYIGKHREEVRCSQCESVLEGPPFTLPCKDVLCDQCYDVMQALGENQCHRCHQEFSDDWVSQCKIAKKNAIDKLKDYHKRCNKFFMDVVSQLCFAENTAPSPEVVRKLLGYIFSTTTGKQQRTRDLTIFDTGIDLNPVFRSFLLQLLIQTSIYLVTHLCRSNGIDVYQFICSNPAPFLRWISIRDMNRDQVVEVSDRYIVCGDLYKTIRKSVTEVLLGENVQHLLETIQALHKAGVRVEPMLQLAVHREVTSFYLYPQQQRELKLQAMETLNTFLQNCDEVKDKEFMQRLATNHLVPISLMTREGEDLRLQGTKCLIIHFQCVMTYLKGDRTLLQPLQALMTNPQTCVNMFLPTMPGGDLEDVKAALLAARKNNGGESPVFYRCPNGHPYVIGDYGRQATVGNCRDCGAVIRGEGYQLRPGNILDLGVDNTLTGHILDRAEVRGRGPKPERTLTPACTATIRLLLHLAMYVGAGRNPQGIRSIIKPEIKTDEVEHFLWAHIQLDVDDIHRAIGRSVDDVFLLMHAVVDNMMKTQNERDHAGGEVCQLSTKRGRQQWEVGLSRTFLQAFLQDIDNVLKVNYQLLVRDQRLGADPLLCLLFETETNEERENPTALQEIPRVWRYTTPISLQHLREEAGAKIQRNQHKVLQLFLKEDHNLRALRYIPSILRLHRTLFQKYQRKLDKAEASQISIAQLKREEIAGGETNQLLQDFAEAWELVRESLTLYLCPTELGGMIVSKEYCNRRIDDKTPVSMLLPTMKGTGLCSYALLDFLMRKHNDFLDKCLKEVHGFSGSISNVNPIEVTEAHLICYDPQHDILPLVMANCQYSFELGEGTEIEYDFAGLERQLMDQFLFSKSRIDVGRVLMIDQMVYRTEFTNAEVFRNLADKIPQQSLSVSLKTQICKEIRYLPDMCTSVDNLDIAIRFLKSTGGQSDKKLHEFMVKTLQMETSVHSQKARQECEFRHAKSLWLLLSLQKSKKMKDNNQHTESIFESVLGEFHEELPDEVQTSFEAYLQKLSIETLSQLVEVLHEYILLAVAVRQNPEDEDYTDTAGNKLREWLYGYIERLGTSPLDLTGFPKEILNEHSVHTWIRAYDMLKEKQTRN